MSKIKVKINKTKIESFSRILEGLISSGKNDIYLSDGQTKIYIYLGDEDFTTLVLNINGSWELE